MIQRLTKSWRSGEMLRWEAKAGDASGAGDADALSADGRKELPGGGCRSDSVLAAQAQGNGHIENWKQIGCSERKMCSVGSADAAAGHSE